MKSGDSISKNFVLDKQIKNMEELSKHLTEKPSIYWRFRIINSSFLIGWPFRTLMNDVKIGVFWTIKNKNQFNSGEKRK